MFSGRIPALSPCSLARHSACAAFPAGSGTSPSIHPALHFCAACPAHHRPPPTAVARACLHVVPAHSPFCCAELSTTSAAFPIHSPSHFRIFMQIPAPSSSLPAALFAQHPSLHHRPPQTAILRHVFTQSVRLRRVIHQLRLNSHIYALRVVPFSHKSPTLFLRHHCPTRFFVQRPSLHHRPPPTRDCPMRICM